MCFLAFIMGFHKMGYFFFLAVYLIRLMAPCPPALAPAPFLGHRSVEHSSSTRQRDSLRRHVSLPSSFIFFIL